MDWSERKTSCELFIYLHFDRQDHYCPMRRQTRKKAEVKCDCEIV